MLPCRRALAWLQGVTPVAQNTPCACFLNVVTYVGRGLQVRSRSAVPLGGISEPWVG